MARPSDFAPMSLPRLLARQETETDYLSIPKGAGKLQTEPARLVAERNSAFELNPMPDQIDPGTLSMLSRVETATIGHWRHWGFCDRGIRRLSSGAAITGTAVTVACPAPDNALVHYVTALLRPGDILVIDRLNNRDIACFGEVVMRACMAAGAAGVVIDGPCTDSQSIVEAGFPVWCRGSSSRTTNVCGIAGKLNAPIAIGGVVVNPGDALLCDDNGILVLPPQEVEFEAQQAYDRILRSQKTMNRIAAGERLPDISNARSLIERGS